ncbi:photosystem II S4 domain [Chlorella sorokiniana]|uniref:Photosystem II S4 domain n=1 Tax=Chlorella sorokiniana TaxID=3076 RepID=A0A2P6TLW0_CHLSO|nr:photosystem II S4 domain [Chlorella sorokiniana]|eukprot:PRW45323.1 photosystem II S4 domain [Chlorella sorokiniana]
MAVLQRMADVAAVPWGGYPQAERCRLSLGREEALAGAAEDPSQLDSVAAVQCRGNFMFDPATHRDFLGACLGTGIERSKVGDIVVTGEQGCQILCSPALVEHLEAELTQVRTVPVQTQAISLSELQVRAPRIEEISSVEASLRLDAVASAGFRVSRSKMMDMIKAGDVRVNWRSGCKPSSEVKAGDVISVAGKGRLEVRGASMTKKGKYSVQMARFL